MQATRTKAIAAGVGNTLVKSGSGYLGKLLVTTTGTGTSPVLIYDSINANTNGTNTTIIGEILGNSAMTGVVFQFDMPAGTGIVVQNPANGPAFTLVFA